MTRLYVLEPRDSEVRVQCLMNVANETFSLGYQAKYFSLEFLAYSFRYSKYTPQLDAIARTGIIGTLYNRHLLYSDDGEFNHIGGNISQNRNDTLRSTLQSLEDINSHTSFNI